MFISVVVQYVLVYVFSEDCYNILDPMLLTHHKMTCLRSWDVMEEVRVFTNSDSAVINNFVASQPFSWRCSERHL